MSQVNHSKLIESLKNPAIWPHPVSNINVVETHISTVFLTGEFAYKIKKPLNLGFLDFSQLSDRKRFCEEEVRLNQRLAPGIYLESVAVTGTPEQPVIGGDGVAIEYAVKMRQFDTSQQLDRLLAQHQLAENHIDRIADQVADFHGRIARADDATDFGEPGRVFFPMQQNFDQLRPLIKDPQQIAQLQRLEHWTQQRYAELEPVLTARKQQGFIRECHGDMHLGNITLMNDDIAIFDGIEFNDYFRWIDVISEIAFLTMDLTDRGASPLAFRLLNRYLEHTGDYAGLTLLRFYQVYRAMVRAKVSSIRLSQSGLEESERQQILRQYQSYADLAEQFTQPGRPAIYLMHGLSGSGKSVVSGELLTHIGAVRIRSDRERKRLFGEAEADRGTLNAGIYNPEATKRTYQHLLDCCEHITGSGFPVFVDATFLQRAKRQPFQALATRLKIPFAVLALSAPLKTLQQRVGVRRTEAGNISDASDDVIIQQRTQAELPGAEEPHVNIDSGNVVNYEWIIGQLEKLSA